MTTISKLLQVLGVAALLAAVAISLPAGTAHAAPKSAAQQDCESRGYLWNSKVGACEDHSCMTDKGPAAPGTTRVVNGVMYQCNGLNGNWDVVQVPHKPPPTAGLRYPLGGSTPGAVLPDVLPTGYTVGAASHLGRGGLSPR